jgi:hypothetical protein
VHTERSLSLLIDGEKSRLKGIREYGCDLLCNEKISEKNLMGVEMYKSVCDCHIIPTSAR